MDPYRNPFREIPQGRNNPFTRKPFVEDCDFFTNFDPGCQNLKGPAKKKLTKKISLESHFSYFILKCLAQAVQCYCYLFFIIEMGFHSSIFKNPLCGLLHMWCTRCDCTLVASIREAYGNVGINFENFVTTEKSKQDLTMIKEYFKILRRFIGFYL